MITESKDTHWYKVHYKFPKKFNSGTIPGSIPGFTDQKSGGFFVPAKNLEGAHVGINKMFATYRKRYGKHALTIAEVKKLDFKVAKISKSTANDEALYTILDGTPKLGGEVILNQEYHKGVHKVIKAHPRSDPMAYTKVNTLPTGGNWSQGFTVACNDKDTYLYLLKKE
jgi:hypothetical protein